MAETDIIKRKIEFSKLGSFKESISPFTHFLYMQFMQNGIPLSGEHVTKMNVRGKEIPVIFRFNGNGLIHSENESLPAVEYLGHWEYWKNGLIDKVVERKADGMIEEYWV